MACGTPVLLSRQVGLAAEVLANRAGWIVSLDAAGLSRGLTEAASNPAELAARGTAARALVRERFTWPRIAQEWIALYQKLSSQKDESVISHERVVDCG
jgi:glycosyltransferase involved in cell wall biosynthesis